MNIPKDCLIQNADELKFVQDWMIGLNDLGYYTDHVGEHEVAQKAYREADALFEEISMYEHFSMTEEEFWGAA